MGLENIFRVREEKSALVEEARDNPYFDVRMYRVGFPGTDMPERRFFTIEHKFFATAAVCLDERDRVLLLRLPRFPHRKVPGDEYFWDLPGGRSKREESPRECAERELLEETGLVARELRPLLGDYHYPESSFGTERLYLFLATGVTQAQNPEPTPEGETRWRWFELEEAVAMAFGGKIRSSWTLLGLLATKILRNRELAGG